ncbi:MAG: twin-arginine translocase TatA/TatE family subunit [Candidatus Daviesbacteria bacterium]|nr:twin-arginine translocase TatA/TatE family subunit [Candidatus Daviesbacteria bacterium]
MFNLGSKEILIIALIILFLFGSKKLTEWAKGLGEAGRELKKAKKEFSNAIDETDKELEKAKKEIISATDETNKNIKRTFDIEKKAEDDGI